MFGPLQGRAQQLPGNTLAPRGRPNQQVQHRELIHNQLAVNIPRGQLTEFCQQQAMTAAAVIQSPGNARLSHRVALIVGHKPPQRSQISRARLTQATAHRVLA